MFQDGVLLIPKAFSIILPILISGLFFIYSMKKGWLQIFNKPIDFGFKVGKAELFGPNKKWRGVVCYVLGGTFVTYLLHLAQPSQTWIAELFVNDPFVLGISSCSAYVAGELINSFIKRRLNIAPGTKGGFIQRFFDNTDGALAMGVVFIFIYKTPMDLLLIAWAISYFVHASTDVLMRNWKLKAK
jgi:ABC-type Fe3+-siderophore transport system permease subunit